MLSFRVPTTSVGQRVRGQRGSEGEKSVLHTRFLGPHHLCGGKGCRAQGVKGSKGVKGSEAYSILGFMVPPPLWEQGVRGKGEQRG